MRILISLLYEDKLEQKIVPGWTIFGRHVDEERGLIRWKGEGFIWLS
jgi:hypothetical protein